MAGRFVHLIKVPIKFASVLEIECHPDHSGAHLLASLVRVEWRRVERLSLRKIGGRRWNCVEWRKK